jgi:hypothetical protein
MVTPPEKRTNKDMEKAANILAVAVSQKAIKAGRVASGWGSYMRVAFMELLRQGYRVIDLDGKEIKVDKYIEKPDDRKMVGAATIIWSDDACFITPQDDHSLKKVKARLEECRVEFEEKTNKTTHLSILKREWVDIVSHEFKLLKGSEYALLESTDAADGN